MIESSGESAAPLLILGGHRSGTSLISGLLWHAGLHMGDLLPPGPDNPRGFFESADLLEVHEGMLRAQERDWTCPPHRLDVNTVDLGPLEEALEGLRRAGRPWGVKDPRLLFLLPAWVRCLPAMRLLGVVRHPAAVAASLEARNGFSPQVARVIADTSLARLAGLQRHLGFPVVDYDAADGTLLGRVREVADALGLAWAEAAAGELYSPALRHQRPQGRGGEDYDYLVRAAGQGIALTAYPAWAVEEALAAIPDRAVEATPTVVGPAFLARRHELWVFASPRYPPLSRVLDVVPEGGHRDELLHGVDRVEIDAAVLTVRHQLRGAHPAGRYSHVLLAGVVESIPQERLARLLDWLCRATASDAAVALDAFLVDGNSLPEVRRWSRVSASSARSGPLYHHHLDEVEVAALGSGWLVGEAALSAEGRSKVLLVKWPGRRAPEWRTPAERRALVAEQGRQIAFLEAEEARNRPRMVELDGALERERARNRLAYEALLSENADIRKTYHDGLSALRDEIRKLRRLRTISGWLGFQLGRLRPGHLAGGISRRLNPDGR